MLDERRQLVAHNPPQDVEIHAVVSVDQPVARADDLGPGDLWMGLLHGRPDSFGRFADDLHQPNQREIELPVTVKVGPRARAHPLHGLGRQIEQVAP